MRKCESASYACNKQTTSHNIHLCGMIFFEDVDEGRVERAWKRHQIDNIPYHFRSSHFMKKHKMW